jgi:t-SNARE complex subunit, syntaxin
MYFDEDTPTDQYMTSNLMDLWQENDNEMIDRQFESSRPGVSKTQQQLLLMEEDNAAQARIRSQEVDHIVKSIVDLNHLFKDLSHMVVHQVNNYNVVAFHFVGTCFCCRGGCGPQKIEK